MSWSDITAGGTNGPGGQPPAPQVPKEYASLKRNILEVELERRGNQEGVSFDCRTAKSVCDILKLNVINETEGYQFHFSGKSIVLALWVRGDMNLDLFSRADGFDVCEGIFATCARPANRVRVNAVIVDLHYNVPDWEVCRYFEAFGAKLVN